MTILKTRASSDGRRKRVEADEMRDFKDFDDVSRTVFEQGKFYVHLVYLIIPLVIRCHYT